MYEFKNSFKYGVGLNNIDLEACEKRDITIGWTGGVNKLFSNEATLGYNMLCRNLFITSNELTKMVFGINQVDFRIKWKKLGISGSYIGKELIRLLKPFNCEILVNDIINQEEYYKENNLKKIKKYLKLVILLLFALLLW